MIQSIRSHLPNRILNLISILAETDDVEMTDTGAKGPEKITITSQTTGDEVGESEKDEIKIEVEADKRLMTQADATEIETVTDIVERTGSEGDEFRMIEKKKRKRGSDVDGVRKGNVGGEKGRSVSIRMAMGERIDHLLWIQARIHSLRPMMRNQPVRPKTANTREIPNSVPREAIPSKTLLLMKRKQPRDLVIDT
jgi:hypothetical protein